MSKPILCLDFDGVVHSYASGWKGPMEIPDPPIPGAIEAIREYTETFRVCIHSSRFNWVNNPRDDFFRDLERREKALLGNGPTPQHAVRDWLVKHGIPVEWIATYADRYLETPALWADSDSCRIFLVETKPPAIVTIDDRAITFSGVFPPASSLRQFKPWNK